MSQPSYTPYNPPTFLKDYVIRQGESIKAYEGRILSDIKLTKEETWIIICHHAFQNKEASSEWKDLAKKYFLKWQLSLKQKSPLAMLHHQLNSLKVLHRLGKSSIISGIFLLVTAGIILAVLGGSTAGIGIAVFALTSGISTLGFYWWTRRKTIKAEEVVLEKEFVAWSAVSQLPLLEEHNQRDMEKLCQFLGVPEDMVGMRLFLFLNTLPTDNRQTVYASIILDLYKFNCHRSYPVAVSRLLETFILYKDSNSLVKNTHNEKIETIFSLIFLSDKNINIYEVSKLITDLLDKYACGNYLPDQKKIQLLNSINEFITAFFNDEVIFRSPSAFVQLFFDYMGEKIEDDNLADGSKRPLIYTQISHGSTHETEMQVLLGEEYFAKRHRIGLAV